MSDHNEPTLADATATTETTSSGRPSLRLNDIYAKFKELDPRKYGVLPFDKVNKMSADLKFSAENIPRTTKFVAPVSFGEIFEIVAGQLGGYQLPQLPASLNVVFKAFRQADEAKGGHGTVPFSAFARHFAFYVELGIDTNQDEVDFESAVARVAGPRQKYKLNTFRDGVRRFGRDGNGRLTSDEAKHLFRYLDLDLGSRVVDGNQYGMQELLEIYIQDKSHQIFVKQLNMNEVYKSFDWCDLDHSGFLQSSELAKAMQLAGQNPSQEDLKQIRKKFDTNFDNVIDFDEFALVVAEKFIDPETMRKKAFEAFAVFDQDKSGFITLSELRRVLTTYGEDMSDEEVDKLFSTLDTDNNGKLDINEFVAVLLK